MTDQNLDLCLALDNKYAEIHSSLAPYESQIRLLKGSLKEYPQGELPQDIIDFCQRCYPGQDSIKDPFKKLMGSIFGALPKEQIPDYELDLWFGGILVTWKVPGSLSWSCHTQRESWPSVKVRVSEYMVPYDFHTFVAKTHILAHSVLEPAIKKFSYWKRD